MTNSILDSVQSLPPLSKTVLDINKIYEDPDSSIMDLVRVVEHDPMIVANLLKAANSALYGFSKEIKNVSQAVMLFGMSMTRSIALSNAVRKLLNVDMQPYGISSDSFAKISEKQATLLLQWYKQIDKQKADKLFLASFVQEMGKILIANSIIQDDETTSFASELELSNNIAQVEKMYTGMSSSEVSAHIFEHWRFDEDFVNIIRYADEPQVAPEEIKEYATALHIVKAIVPVNKPFSDIAIQFGLQQAQSAGYDVALLENAINELK